MTIAFSSAGAIAYSATNGTSVAPAYPASPAAGDLLLLVIGHKPSTANAGNPASAGTKGVVTPSGWIPVVQVYGAGGYTTTLATDTGNTNLFAYYKLALGTETGTLAVTLAVNSVSWAQISRFTKTGNTWRVSSTFGSDTTAGAFSAAGQNNIFYNTGDLAVAAICVPTAASAGVQWSAESIAATGATIGTLTEIAEASSTNGLGIGGVTAYKAVTGSVSTAAPTLTATAATSTNARGPALMMRLREYTPAANAIIHGPQSFNGTAGAALPSAAGSGFGLGITPTGGSAVISSTGDSAQLTCGSTGGYAGADRVSTRAVITTDPEDAVIYMKAQFVTETYPGLWVRNTNTAIDTQGGLGLTFGQTNTWDIVKHVNYGALDESVISPTAQSFTFTTGVWYWFAFGAVNADIKAKIWQDGTTEPNWQIQVQDASINWAGPEGFSVGGGSAASTKILIDEWTSYNYFPVYQVGAAALTSATTLTAAGSIPVSGAAALTSSTSAVMSGTVTQSATAVLQSNTVLTTTGTQAVAASASLASATALTTSGIRSAIASVSMASTATLTAIAFAQYFASVALSSNTSLSSTGTLSVAASATLSETSTLIAGGTATRNASCALASSTSLTTAGVLSQAAGAAFSSTTVLTSAGIVTELGTVGLAMTSALAVAGTLGQAAIVSMSSATSLVSAATTQAGGGLALVETSTLSVTGLYAGLGSVNFSETSVLAVAGLVSKLATVALVSSTVLTTAGVRTSLGVVSLTASSVLTAGALVSEVATASLTSATLLTVSAASGGSQNGSVVLSETSVLTVTAATGTASAVASLAEVSGLVVGATLVRLGLVNLSSTTQTNALGIGNYRALVAMASITQLLITTIVSQVFVRSTVSGLLVRASPMIRNGSGNFVPAEIWVRNPNAGNAFTRIS